MKSQSVRNVYAARSPRLAAIVAGILCTQLATASDSSTEDVVDAVEQAYQANYGKIGTLKATIVRTNFDPSVTKDSVSESRIGKNLTMTITQRREWKQVTQVAIAGTNERYDNKMPDWEDLLIIRNGKCTVYSAAHKLAIVFPNTRENYEQWPFQDVRNIGFFAPGDRIPALLNSGRVDSAYFQTSMDGTRNAHIEIRLERQRIVGLECSSRNDLLPDRIYYKNRQGMFDYFADITYRRFHDQGGSFLLPIHCKCHFGSPKQSLDPTLWEGSATTVIDVTDIVVGASTPPATFDIPKFVEGTRIYDVALGNTRTVGAVATNSVPASEPGRGRGAWLLIGANIAAVFGLMFVLLVQYLRRARTA
jgi:hypothetical protein